MADVSRRRAAAQAAEFPTIDSLDDVGAGVAHLTAACPQLARAFAATGMPPLRREPPGFASLADIVVSQLVSLAAADAISARLKQVTVPFEPAILLALGDDRLRACGLSGAKVNTLTGIARAIAEGRLDLDGLAGCGDDEARARLMALSGVGPWTADIYVMFCLGRRDGFAPGDLALRVAVAALFGLELRPSITAVDRIALRWQPWRGVAARLLWAYYRVLKARGDAVSAKLPAVQI